jgi:2-amino-4-hydroxy-6-hydroxymethyldihydropteridine diphosphokinase
VKFIGIGGNLPCATFGAPRRTCGAALSLLAARGVDIVARSRWFESAPVPASDQPWYINGVAAVATTLDAAALVAEVLHVEAELGRQRSTPNAPRTIDIDVLAYDDVIIAANHPGAIEIPHPRLHKRAFVLMPLQDIAPDWRHPVSGIALSKLIEGLPKDQTCRPIPDADGAYGTEWGK